MKSRSPELNETEIIEAALIAARQQRPYYARAISALTPRCVDGLGTIAVDCRWNLYVDPEWFASLTFEQRATIIAQHEVEHLIRSHGSRAKDICAEGPAWNVCADAEINDDADGPLPANGVYPKTLGQKDGQTAEYYYSQIEDCQGGCSGGSGAGNPLPGEDPDGVQPEDEETLLDQVASDVRECAKSAPGTVPKHVEIWANSRARTPVLDWRRLLTTQISRLSRTIKRGRQDWSWSRPSRRSREVLKPGMVDYQPSISVIVDTSGSMYSRGEDVLGTVKGIVSRFGDVSVLQCDTEVKSRTKGAPKTYVGGGGTDLSVAFDAAKSDIVIVITDGETPWPEPRKGVVGVTWSDCCPLPAWIPRVEIKAPAP